LLTRLVVRNFKRFQELDIELGNPVVLIGPNNSGKTTILQALALWEIGVKRWIHKRGNKPPERRPGVTINRRDLIALPVPDTNLLWHGLRVRASQRCPGGSRTQNVRVDILVEGVLGKEQWQCGLEFDYANEESLYCRPLRRPSGERMAVPRAAADVRIAYLTPMSGLAAQEDRLDPGAINVRIGEGRTAEVLRNLCYRLLEFDGGNRWNTLKNKISSLFYGTELEEPRYIQERGQITLCYREHGVRMDLSCSGRGLQQTLLLLAFLYSNRGAVLLVDEPDAHLEILRQQQIYQVLTEVAREQGNQIIAASHSEVVLNEAAGRDVVIALVGKPHRIDGRGSQVSKALKEIGFEDYYRAEHKGWVLYLEGSTDLAILRSLARKLGHQAQVKLERAFVKYVGNDIQRARSHFFGLKEAKPDLVGMVLLDHQDRFDPRTEGGLVEVLWQRREIENYLCHREVLLEYAAATARLGMGELFDRTEGDRRRAVMAECIEEIEKALHKLGKDSPWSAGLKVSDEFLTPLFAEFFKRLGLPNLMRKSDFHVLADHMPVQLIDPEVANVFDQLVDVAARAAPAMEEPEL